MRHRGKTLIQSPAGPAFLYRTTAGSVWNPTDKGTGIPLWAGWSQSGGSILAENNIHIDMSNNQLAESSYVSLMVWILLAAVIIYLVDITIRKSIFRKKEKKEVNQVADNYF